MFESVTRPAVKLLEYCRENDWAGFDPYDALNSRVFIRTPFSRSRIFRIAFTQLLKRLPVDLRPMLLVTREQNPKAISLFLKAGMKLSELGLLDDGDLSKRLVDRLVALRSKDTPYWCWGYSFPWQTRTILVPRGAPNLVCTYFVADALLDAYEVLEDKRLLEMATSAGNYILDELYWTEAGSVAGFAYPHPSARQRVHNANLLGASLLCRLYSHYRDEKYLDPALKVAQYSVSRQKSDGSWSYGESPKQRWVDNFHTGYNLCALRNMGESLGTRDFEECLGRGFELYRSRFFRKDGAPAYYIDRTYPIDIHSAAQSIITLTDLKDLSNGDAALSHAVYRWTMENMWDERGFFYYRVYPFFKNRIPYMRWSQAWMLLALSTLLEDLRGGDA